MVLPTCLAVGAVGASVMMARSGVGLSAGGVGSFI